MADDNVVEEISEGLLEGKANLKTVSFSRNNIEKINNFIDDVRSLIFEKFFHSIFLGLCRC